MSKLNKKMNNLSEESVRKELLRMFWQEDNFTEMSLSQIYDKLNITFSTSRAKEYKPTIMELINDLFLNN
jgi:hypothetical protein